MKKLLLALALLAAPALHAQAPPGPPAVSVAPAPTYANFVPIFTNVQVVYDTPAAGFLSSYTVNPLYCLDPDSAVQLQQILSGYGVKIFFTGPAGWTSNYGATVSQQVPWFIFPDGTPINAGILASEWTHGYSIDFIKQVVNATIAQYQSLTAQGYNWSLQVQNLPQGN